MQVLIPIRCRPRPTRSPTGPAPHIKTSKRASDFDMVKQVNLKSPQQLIWSRVESYSRVARVNCQMLRHKLERHGFSDDITESSSKVPLTTPLSDIRVGRPSRADLSVSGVCMSNNGQTDSESDPVRGQPARSTLYPVPAGRQRPVLRILHAWAAGGRNSALRGGVGAATDGPTASSSRAVS